jgi:hypothetical protein
MASITSRALAAAPLGEIAARQRPDHGAEQDAGGDYLLPGFGDAEVLGDLQ